MKIIFVWCWWTGISALVKIFKNLGYTNIVWIDNSESQITKQLKQINIPVIIWHWKIQVNPEDLVIYSDATSQSEEVKKAKKKISYFEFLGELSKYFITIWISWTHWKSTTTALTIYGFKNLFPENLALGIVWALVPDLGNENFYLNTGLKSQIKNIIDHIVSFKFKNFDYWLIKKYFFIVESDEFNYHFLYLDPDIAGITNIDRDHTDVYPSVEKYYEAFANFVKLTRYKVFTFPKQIDKIKNYLLPKELKKINTIESLVNIDFKYLIWEHNIENWNIAINILSFVSKNFFNKKVDTQKLVNSIKNFKWLWRRLEIIGYVNVAMIFSDYAHHPKEINAIYNALKNKYPNKKLKIIFQPHQWNRLLSFFDQFVQVLKPFDEKFIYKIYAARENINLDELWQDLANKINGTYITKIESINHILKNLSSEDILVVATAWDLDFKIRQILWN